MIREPHKKYTFRWWLETVMLVATLTWVSTFFWARTFSDVVFHWISLPVLAVVFAWDLWDLVKYYLKSDS